MIIVFLARKTLFAQKGGDTVQIFETAHALEKLGHQVHIIGPNDSLPQGTDVLHFFNIGRPADGLNHFLSFKGRKVVSTIYVEYAKGDVLRWPVLMRFLGSHRMEYIKVIARAIKGVDRWPSVQYLWLGQKKSMRKILKCSEVIITSSFSELERIKPLCKGLGGKEIRDKHRTIPLGVHEIYLNSPATYNGVRSGLLMVGRLEWLKGQLDFIKLARKLDWPLTVVGDANVNQPEYYNLCREAAGETVRFLPYQNASDVLELMDRHAVFVVPSRFESYSLVAWEAASRGMYVVANKVPDMQETLSQVAHLVSIDREDEVIAAVEDGLQTMQLVPQIAQKKSQVQWENYTWDAVGRRIENCYS